jgi:hypothetical protein
LNCFSYKTKGQSGHRQQLAYKTQATTGTQDTGNNWHTRHRQQLAYKTQDEDKKQTNKQTKNRTEQQQKKRKKKNTKNTKKPKSHNLQHRNLKR